MTDTPPPLTDEQIEELARLEREAAWAAPWTVHSFEIECPCPNGEDCGNLHACDEVEAREAYPFSPDDPADEGEGQCVVQIAVPGLESLAGPNARFIAAARNALPALLDAYKRQREALWAVIAQAHPPDGSGLTLGDLVMHMERIARTALSPETPGRARGEDAP
jgi:hypothetical protein